MTFDLNKDIDKKVHFIGIGGISMSGLAEILLKYGYRVSGSDMKSSPITDKLVKNGAKIFYNHDASNVNGADLIVYTAAIASDNPELQTAIKSGIPMMDRAEFLGAIMKGHAYNIAVTGTHGKTTTTSMVSHILMEAKVDPTILVGGELDLIDGNVRTGESEYFVTEACEYKESFLKFYPYIGIILNVDADHLDYYKDINHIHSSFSKFAALIPDNGYLIGYADDCRVQQIMDESKSNIISYGLNSGDLTASNIQFNEKGCASFDVFNKGTHLCDAKLSVPGKHNVLNALAAIASALALNIDITHIINGLAAFTGTHKRFELKGVKNNITVIDDYAHHPTEIKATLSTAKNYPNNRVICVFQPHTYSRTITLLDDFANSFYDADEIILADIYAAREKDTGIVSSNTLGDMLRAKDQNCTNIHSFEDIVLYLNKNLKPGDLLLTVGAGDIVKVGEMFLKTY